MKAGSKLFRNSQAQFSALSLVLSLATITLSGCGTPDSPQPVAQPDSKPAAEPSATTTVKGDLPKKDAETQFSIDEVQGKTWDKKDKSFNLKKSDTFVISGWAVDSVTNEPAPQVYLLIDDGISVPAVPVKRPDLAEGFKIPSWENAGYTLTLDCSKLSPGKHTAAFRIVGTGSKYYYEPEHLTLNIK